MTTLTVLGRINRHLADRYPGQPLPYDIAQMKRLVVVGVCYSALKSDINQLAAVTCETPEEVHSLIRRWRKVDKADREAWIGIARGH